MKTDKIILEEQDKMEVVATKPDKTQKLIHSIRPHKGHTLFEINPITGKCKEAVYEKTDVEFGKNGMVHKKVIRNNGCVYISALNKKNALIKFFKMVGRQMTNQK